MRVLDFVSGFQEDLANLQPDRQELYKPREGAGLMPQKRRKKNNKGNRMKKLVFLIALSGMLVGCTQQEDQTMAPAETPSTADTNAPATTPEE